MGVVISIFIGTTVWLVTWAFGLKGFDGFLIMLLIILIGATAHLIMPYLPGRRPADEGAPDPAPFL